MGSKFGFGGQSWVRVRSKQFEVKFIILGFDPTIFYPKYFLKVFLKLPFNINL